MKKKLISLFVLLILVSAIFVVAQDVEEGENCNWLCKVGEFLFGTGEEERALVGKAGGIWGGEALVGEAATETKKADPVKSELTPEKAKELLGATEFNKWNKMIDYGKSTGGKIVLKDKLGSIQIDEERGTKQFSYFINKPGPKKDAPMEIDESQTKYVYQVEGKEIASQTTEQGKEGKATVQGVGEVYFSDFGVFKYGEFYDSKENAVNKENPTGKIEYDAKNEILTQTDYEDETQEITNFETGERTVVKGEYDEKTNKFKQEKGTTYLGGRIVAERDYEEGYQDLYDSATGRFKGTVYDADGDGKLDTKMEFSPDGKKVTVTKDGKEIGTFKADEKGKFDIAKISAVTWKQTDKAKDLLLDVESAKINVENQEDKVKPLQTTYNEMKAAHDKAETALFEKTKEWNKNQKDIETVSTDINKLKVQRVKLDNLVDEAGERLGEAEKNFNAVQGELNVIEVDRQRLVNLFKQAKDSDNIGEMDRLLAEIEESDEKERPLISQKRELEGIKEEITAEKAEADKEYGEITQEIETKSKELNGLNKEKNELKVDVEGSEQTEEAARGAEEEAKKELGPEQEKLDEEKEKLKEKEDELKDEDSTAKVFDHMESKSSWEKATSAVEAIYAATGAPKAFPGLSNLFYGSTDFYKNWRDNVDRVFAPMLGERWFASAICDSYHDITPEGAAMIQTPSGTYQAVASIQAERTSQPTVMLCMGENQTCPEDFVCRDELCYENEDAEEPKKGYFYKITWGVSSPRDEKLTPLIDENGVAVSFNIWVDDVSLYAYNGDRQGPIQLKNGESDGDTIVHFSPNPNLGEACIKWKQAPETQDWPGTEPLEDVCFTIKTSDLGRVEWENSGRSESGGSRRVATGEVSRNTDW